MDKNKENVPKIRFPGFTSPWEQRKVKDIFKVTRGYVLAATETTDKKTDEMPYPVYSSQTKDNGLMGYYKDFLYENAITWTTDGANAGTVNYREGKFYCTNVCGVLLSDDGYANKMVSEALNNISWKHVSKVGNPKLMNNVMSEIVVSLPKTIEEQNIISDLLNRLDNLINLHQRKLNHLQDKKKSLLQKMFPKNGEDCPELRFPGFTDPWEQRKLGEISDSFEYGLNAAATEFDGVNKYIRITDIDDESRRFLETDLTSPNVDLSNADNYKLKSGDILFTRTGASVGKSYIYKEYDGLVYYAGFLIRARIKPEYDAEFVFQSTLTNKYNKYIRITSQRSGQPGVNAQEYAEFKLRVPEYDEQSKIGLFLKQLDNLITLHQRKLNHLQEQKKALLQQMFV